MSVLDRLLNIFPLPELTNTKNGLPTTISTSNPSETPVIHNSMALPSLHLLYKMICFVARAGAVQSTPYLISLYRHQIDVQAQV